MAKLFNTIIVWDVYAIAEDEADARAAAIANILEGLPASEQVAREVGKQAVRAAWVNEKPLVGSAVSDEDFEKIKGKTCEQVWTEANIKSDKKAK